MFANRAIQFSSSLVTALATMPFGATRSWAGLASAVRSSLVIWLTVIVCLIVATPASHAAFVPVAGAMDRLREYKQDWTWDFAHGMVNPSNIAGVNWNRVVESRAPGIGQTGPAVTLGVRHLKNPDGMGEIAPNPPDMGMMPQFNRIQFTNIPRPMMGMHPDVNGAPTSVIHPNLPGHVDMLYLRLTVPAGMAMVDVRATGKHFNLETLSANWSYEPFERGVVTVDASYETGSNHSVLGPTTVDPMILPHLEGSLAIPGEPRRPTDYVTSFTPLTGSPTQLTLAFPGEVDGVPGHMDLAGGFDLLTFSEDLAGIVAPLLVNAETMSPAPLFISVDLSLWLSGAIPYSPGQPFPIMAGKHNDLPGYLFSTSPTSFVPFEGLVRVAGNVDGSTSIVPEPATLSLLGIGVLSLLAYGRWQMAGAKPQARG